MTWSPGMALPPSTAQLPSPGTVVLPPPMAPPSLGLWPVPALLPGAGVAAGVLLSVEVPVLPVSV